MEPHSLKSLRALYATYGSATLASSILWDKRDVTPLGSNYCVAISPLKIMSCREMLRLRKTLP